MSAQACGTTIPRRKVTCIQDAIGHDGIDAYVERSLALGRHVVGKPDVEGARRFASLFVGSYERGTGLYTRRELKKIFLPAGYLHVQIHAEDPNAPMTGIYGKPEKGMINAQTVARAIATLHPVHLGAVVIESVFRKSDLPGVLEIVVSISAPFDDPFDEFMRSR